MRIFFLALLAMLVFGPKSFADDVGTTNDVNLCRIVADRFHSLVAASGKPSRTPIEVLADMPKPVIILGEQSAQYHSVDDILGVLRRQYHATRKLLDIVSELDDSALTIDRPGKSSIWAVHSEGGTLDCSSFLFFDAPKGQPAQLIDSPGRDSDFCAFERAWLAEVSGQPAFVSINEQQNYFELTITPYSGRGWGQECKLRIDYDK